MYNVQRVNQQKLQKILKMNENVFHSFYDRNQKMIVYSRMNDHTCNSIDKAHEIMQF